MFDFLKNKFPLNKPRSAESEITFIPFEDEHSEPVVRKQDNISEVDNEMNTSFKPAQDRNVNANNIELKVVKPEEFSEVSTVADYLIEGSTVVLNVESLAKDVARRMLDFLNGVTYSVDGQIKKVAVNTYILTPSSVDVTEDEDEKQGLVTE